MSKSKSSRKSRTHRKRLLYNISDLDGGLVFAEPERARFVSRIHEAIRDSSTWGEFRRAMPPEEYARLFPEHLDEGDEDRPSDPDEFDEGDVPGYGDGNYPPWLQQEMHEVVPEEVLDEFAEVEETMTDGPYHRIDPEHLPAIKARLEALGYAVEDGTHLSFF